MSFLTEYLGLTAQQRLIASAVGLAATVGVAAWWYRRTSKLVWKPVGKLSAIWIHPIKSCRGQQVSSAECTPDGLWSNGFFDRNFAVLSDTDTVITLRGEPTLALIESSISEDGQDMILNAPGMEPLSVSFADMEDSKNSVRKFRVWRLPSEGQDCGEEAGTWLCTFLKKSGYKLVHFKEGLTKARRLVEDSKWGEHFTSKDQVKSFQDLAPVMLLTEASLEDLNSHLEMPATMRNMRPNFVVSGTHAFDEDKWKYVRIGETLMMQRTHPCGRCKVITVDTETGVVRSDGEPLATLKQYRVLDKSSRDGKRLRGAPVFGANFVCKEFGIVKVGDIVYAAV